MTIILVAIVLTVLLVFLLNTKRWRALSKGARLSKRSLEEGMRPDEEEP